MLKRHPFGPGLFLAACGCTALLSASACSNNDTNRTGNTGDTSAVPAAQGTSGQRDTTPKPINLTGCLQQGDSRSSYILTEINEPSSRPTATSGSNANGRVEREQMREAQHAYRLDAKDDDELARLVGKKVRVSGTLTDRSDLMASNSDRAHDQGTVGTSGQNDRSKTRTAPSGDRDRGDKISESDLGQVDVTSIEKIADTCGSAAGSSNKGAAKGTKSGRRR